MASRSNGTGKSTSASGSTPEPRPLTPAEIEWLRQVGKDFHEHYEEIRARAMAELDVAAAGDGITAGMNALEAKRAALHTVAEGDSFARVRSQLGLPQRYAR